MVARVSGQPFIEYFSEQVAVPLGMETFTWGLPEATPSTSLGLPGQDAYPLAWMFQGPEANAAVMPAANGWGTARDLGAFYLALSVGGRGWLSPATVRRMVQPAALSSAGGLGFEVGSASLGELAGPRTFGHPGGRTSVGWCDPDTGLVGVILANGAPEESEGERILRLISDAMHRCVMSAL